MIKTVLKRADKILPTLLASTAMICLAGIFKSWAITVEEELIKVRVNSVKIIFFIVRIFYHKEKNIPSFMI